MFHTNSLIIEQASINDFRQMLAEEFTILAEKLKLIPSHIKEEHSQEYLTTNEVCQLLQISRVTLDNWHNSGFISKSKVGRRNYFTRRDIDKALVEGKIQRMERR